MPAFGIIRKGNKLLLVREKLANNYFTFWKIDKNQFKVIIAYANEKVYDHQWILNAINEQLDLTQSDMLDISRLTGYNLMVISEENIYHVRPVRGNPVCAVSDLKNAMFYIDINGEEKRPPECFSRYLKHVTNFNQVKRNRKLRDCFEYVTVINL